MIRTLPGRVFHAHQCLCLYCEMKWNMLTENSWNLPRKEHGSMGIATHIHRIKTFRLITMVNDCIFLVLLIDVKWLSISEWMCPTYFDRNIFGISASFIWIVICTGLWWLKWSWYFDLEVVSNFLQTFPHWHTHYTTVRVWGNPPRSIFTVFVTVNLFRMDITCEPGTAIPLKLCGLSGTRSPLTNLDGLVLGKYSCYQSDSM